jgi:hypothetical protein
MPGPNGGVSRFPHRSRPELIQTVMIWLKH